MPRHPSRVGAPRDHIVDALRLHAVNLDESSVPGMSDPGLTEAARTLRAAAAILSEPILRETFDRWIEEWMGVDEPLRDGVVSLDKYRRARSAGGA